MPYLGSDDLAKYLTQIGLLDANGNLTGNVVTTSGSVSIGTNPATSGAIRLAASAQINSFGDLAFGVNVGAGASPPAWLISGSNGSWAPGPSVAGAIDIGNTGSKVRNVFVASSVVNKVKAGTPTDADVTNATDGMMVLDSSANKIWVRLGGVWKGVVVA